MDLRSSVKSSLPCVGWTAVPAGTVRQQGAHTPCQGSRSLARKTQGSRLTLKPTACVAMCLIFPLSESRKTTPTCLSKVRCKPLSNATSSARRWAAAALSGRSCFNRHAWLAGPAVWSSFETRPLNASQFPPNHSRPKSLLSTPNNQDPES